jgi:hypothetical protein
MPVLDGLELVHQAGFIHRDIKPDNLHIRTDGSPVLLDFGSARASLGQGRTVTILVAPGYAPFEQYYSSGENQGPWTDLYGLGATSYRAIAGVPPLDAITRSKGVLGSSREVLVPARTIGSGHYSETVLRAIDHALQFAEKDRPQSIAEWRRELRRETATAPAHAAPPTVHAAAPGPSAPPPAPAAAPLGRRVAIGAAFAGIAAVAGATGAYFVMQSSKPPPTPVAVATPAPAPTQAPIVPAGFDPSHKLADEKLRADKLAAEKLATERAEADRAVAAKTELDREAAEKAAKAKAIADKAVKAKERLAVPKVEEKRAPQEAVTKPEPEKVALAVPDKPVLSPPAGDVPAFTYFLGFAHRGNGEAMLKVAESYESGRGVAQNGVWACGWYELAGRRGVSGAKARKEAVAIKLQPRELRQCQDWADGQAAPSG